MVDSQKHEADFDVLSFSYLYLLAPAETRHCNILEDWKSKQDKTYHAPTCLTSNTKHHHLTAEQRK